MRCRRTKALLISALFGLVITAGAGLDSATAAANSTGIVAGQAQPTAPNTVEVKDFMFSPQQITVPVGTTVTWKFDDPVGHNVVATDKSFQSPTLSGGMTYQNTFTKAGTYDYRCTIHPFMTGTVIVH